MVYRSSKRSLQDNEDSQNPQEYFGIEHEDMDKQVKFRRQAGMWRTLSFLLIIFSVCLIVALAVVSYRDLLSEKNASLCGQSSNTVHRTIDLSEPERPGPFHDLTTKEIDIINNFVQNDPSIKAKKIEEAKMTDSVVFMMDLLPAKKSVVQAYLAGERAQPERHARVVVFRGDLKPPMVHELDCGPLPEVSSCSLIKSTSRRNPIEFALRPIGPSEYGAIFDVLFQKVDKEIGYILRESYGMSFFDCTPPRCLKAYPAPVGSNIVGNTQHRSIWLGAAYPVDYYTENMVDFGILANMDGSDPSKHHISKIWYHAQYFESVDEFIAKYNQSSIEKSIVKPPSLNPRDSFSSLYRRGDPLPETPQRPPTLVEPDGKRYSLKNREVEYLGWKFNFRMSPFTGPSLNNIRYKGDRIAYELGLSEIAVFYSADNPMQQNTDYVDSGVLIGTHSKSLVPGGDCPEIATFINQTFAGQSNTEPVQLERSFCLFENNHGYPARRHLSYSSFEGAYYGGMLDSALTLRCILTIVNYDYVVDFIFHQTGTIQTRVMSTGYVASAFYNDKERPYGFKTEKNFVANLHHHMFHFKVDLDVSGTSNRYETLDIKPDVVKMRVPPNPDYHQNKFERNLRRTEKSALYKFNFDHPKYHIVHNNDKKTKFGEPKAYRIMMNGMSKQLIPENKGNEASVAWARYQMAVTKHKDDELVSSSPYAMFDSLNPVTNFTKFYEDDENIVDEDLVFWLTCGVHHIPHSEDLPVTPTVGAHLNFFLSPYNYFPHCPSFSSRDHIHISLKDRNNPKEGVTVDRNGNKDEQCMTPQLAKQYDELLRDDPDVVVESRRKKALF